jgi:hypothetical protein
MTEWMSDEQFHEALKIALASHKFWSRTRSRFTPRANETFTLSEAE